VDGEKEYTTEPAGVAPEPAPDDNTSPISQAEAELKALRSRVRSEREAPGRRRWWWFH
jgi:hypothetical protein